MGTDVVVLLPSAHRRDSIRVQQLFADWDRRMSRFRRDSELSRANAAAGTEVEVSRATAEVVAAARRAAGATDGRFDPLLGTRMRELGYDRTFAALPANRTGSALPAWHPGLWRDLHIDVATARVRVPPGGELDLGGIAKGMAVDAALAELRAMGVPYALVSAGGDLAVHGTPPESPAGWPVGIDNVDLLGASTLLRRGALATSSTLGRRWRQGNVERHHLLDPQTGLPMDGVLVQATVSAASCRQAEVAAKVTLQDTLAGASAFILAHGMTAAFVTRDGERVRVGQWH
jgi:thiamine biosynthesis lipoprotein